MSMPPTPEMGEIVEPQKDEVFFSLRPKLRASYSNLVHALERYTQLAYGNSREGVQDLGEQGIISALIQNINDLDKVTGVSHDC